jgi:hypothetical protein
MAALDEALTMSAKFAAEGRCGEPVVLMHDIGGGMLIMPTESREASAALLSDTQMRRLLSLVETLATFGRVEVMATGEAIEREVSTTMAVYEELGLL